MAIGCDSVEAWQKCGHTACTLERPGRQGRPYQTPPAHGDNMGSNPIGDATHKAVSEKWLIQTEVIFDSPPNARLMD